jgi:hypothetical protein
VSIARRLRTLEIPTESYGKLVVIAYAGGVPLILADEWGYGFPAFYLLVPFFLGALYEAVETARSGTAVTYAGVVRDAAKSYPRLLGGFVGFKLVLLGLALAFVPLGAVFAFTVRELLTFYWWATVLAAVYVHFFDVAIVTEDESLVASFKRSVEVVRANRRRVFAYAAVVSFPYLLFFVDTLSTAYFDFVGFYAVKGLRSVGVPLAARLAVLPAVVLVLSAYRVALYENLDEPGETV